MLSRMPTDIPALWANAKHMQKCYSNEIMSIFSVSEAKEKALAETFQALDIREDDISESFIRSSGKAASM